MRYESVQNFGKQVIVFSVTFFFFLFYLSSLFFFNDVQSGVVRVV